MAADFKSNRYPLAKLHRDCGGRCHLCGKPVLLEDATRDHVVTTSRGGTNAKKNIKLAHQACNSARGDLTLEEWFNLPPVQRRQMLKKHWKISIRLKESAPPT
ncbi:MAG: HNH endonuclease [Actinobacteria bacterium]|nr:HNH endonuclease [Actinomycetota bacterium]